MKNIPPNLYDDSSMDGSELCCGAFIDGGTRAALAAGIGRLFTALPTVDEAADEYDKADAREKK